MSKTTTEHKKTRIRYSQQYKDEALALAERVGMSKAAAQLGLKEAQLYTWRTKARQVMNTGEREQQLADENVRLKRQLAEHIGQFQVAAMTRVLGVARSGFYAWRARQGTVSARTLARQRLDARVADAFAAAKERFGAIRITQALAKQGVEHNRKTVAKSLCRQGLRAKAARKFKATT